MYNHRGSAGQARDWQGKPNGKRRPNRDEYNCSTYNLSKQKYQPTCTQHYIRTAVVRELILEAIRSASAYALENEAEFIQKARSASEVRQAEAVKALKTCAVRVSASLVLIRLSAPIGGFPLVNPFLHCFAAFPLSLIYVSAC